MRPKNTRRPFTLYRKQTQAGLMWYARFWDETAAGMLSAVQPEFLSRENAIAGMGSLGAACCPAGYSLLSQAGRGLGPPVGRYGKRHYYRVPQLPGT